MIDWKTLQSQYDQDTLILLRIARDFLCKYFEHEQAAANTLLNSFIEEYGVTYDEDYFHEVSSYFLAAIVHYLQHLRGERNNAHSWAVHHGYNKPPAEAALYFRDNYYGYYRDLKAMRDFLSDHPL